MKKLTIDAPSMYADHHVTEARRILLALPGINAVYASSAFHAVEVAYDPKKIKEADIADALGKAGYLHEISLSEETGLAADNRDFPRHTVAYAPLGTAVHFKQETPTRILQGAIACPGLGVIHMDEE